MLMNKLTRAEVPDAVRVALDAIAEREGFKEPRYDVAPGSNAGDGYTSLLHRAAIKDKDPTGRKDELSVVCKTTMNGTTKGFTNTIFVEEAYMYSTVLPALVEIADLEQPLPWPRLLYSSVGGASSSSCIALSDLRPEGYRMADRRAPLDAQHCRLALAQLARFHGAGLALRHLRPEEFRTVVQASLGKHRELPGLRALFQNSLEERRSTADMLKDRFPEGSVARQKVQKIFADYADNYFALTEARGSDSDLGIIHGDCHVNNMMFQYDEDMGAVTGCRLIDFQMSRAGRTTWDLTSLLLPCTDSALRRATHWDDLLRGYHRELQATLRAAGCDDPDAVYSWEQFQVCLREAAPFALCQAPMLAEHIFADEQEARELQEVVSKFDQGGTISAADGAHLKKIARLKDKPELKQRIGDLVQDLLDWGWI